VNGREVLENSLTGIGSLIFSILTKLKKSNSGVLIFSQNIQQIFIPVFVHFLIARYNARHNARKDAATMPACPQRCRHSARKGAPGARKDAATVPTRMSASEKRGQSLRKRDRLPFIGQGLQAGLKFTPHYVSERRLPKDHLPVSARSIW
jgi:hypothetical protein